MATARHPPLLSSTPTSHPDDAGLRRRSPRTLRAAVVACLMALCSTLLAVVAATPAHAGTSLGDRIGEDASIRSGDWLESPNGAYRFVMQTDGNLVLYGPSGPLWATYTRSDGAYLKTQGDGNLVIYTADGRGVVWASRTNGRGGATLVMQNDGNVVAYGGGGAIWSTYTQGGVSKMKASGIVAFARAQLGKPYQYGATGPGSYDCSGLTQRAHASVGVSIARTTYDQWNQGSAVSREALQPGDLVFSNNRGHVAIYVGNNEVIQALKTGTVVSYYSIGYAGPIVGYRRMA